MQPYFGVAKIGCQSLGSDAAIRASQRTTDARVLGLHQHRRRGAARSSSEIVASKWSLHRHAPKDPVPEIPASPYIAFVLKWGKNLSSKARELVMSFRIRHSGEPQKTSFFQHLRSPPQSAYRFQNATKFDTKHRLSQGAFFLSNLSTRNADNHLSNRHILS